MRYRMLEANRVKGPRLRLWLAIMVAGPVLAATLASCVTNRDALEASAWNRRRIAAVKLGDSMKTVLGKMGKDPEIRMVGGGEGVGGM